MRHIFILAILLPLLFACEQNEEPAEPSQASIPAAAQETTRPSVSERAAGGTESAQTGKPNRDTYTVAKGDTLWSVANKNGLDYRDLAKWNNIEDPDQIHVGQELQLTAPGT
jgi:lipoprotein NlpD